jgi:hypothetical protein
MGSKGGGGGYDTSGLEAATEEATALQREIYEQTREDMQPWYKTGASGMGKLADLLGLSGGSVQGREDIYQDLLPQYTSQQTTGGTEDGYLVAPTGEVFNYPTEQQFQDRDYETAQIAYNAYLDKDYDELERRGYGILGGTPTTSDVTDYDALNAAVDERLGSQTTPEGYGSLLERFDMDKFEADPGYQFRQDEAERALERAMSAQGVTLGGGGFGEINPQVARALQEQSQGLASQEYGNAYGRYNADQQNVFNRLMGVSGMGQGAAGQLAGAGQAYGTNVGNLTTGLAGAQANAAAAQAAQPSMLSQIICPMATVAGAALGGPMGASIGSAIGGGLSGGGGFSPSKYLIGG